MASFCTLPDEKTFKLRNGTVPACLVDGLSPSITPDSDGLVNIDIVISDDRIAAILPAGADNGSETSVDLDASMVWPCFVDLHTHIDKGHIWPRRRNPDGTRAGALSSAGADRADNWTAEDLRARMNFSLESAYAHGTAALRTHLDSTPPQHKISWPVASELRDTWAGRIELQAVCLEPLWGYADHGFGTEIADMMVEYGGIMGAVLNVQEDTNALLDFVIGLAIDRGLGLDFHVDEMGDPTATSFDRIAEALIRNDFGKPVNVGHCCSLAIRPQAEIDHALDLAMEARMRVVSLPMCNMYLQDRPDPGALPHTPRWRGVTILHEMKARGIPVAISSDNTRDPFYAYGDLDGAEVFTQAVRIAHLDHPVGDWPAAITRTPADTMGLPDKGRLKEGGPADMVIFSARSYSEFLSRPQHDRTVIRAGRAIDTTPPDYRTLDSRY
ncbi:MAG: cytosine deaminase [Alphaproteobacteria bacterium]|nr:cytosine deaminase [Alphaproteobacteria bacterium]